MEIIVFITIGIICFGFPLVAAIVAFRRGRTGWGIATIASIFLAVGWLVGTLALMQRPVDRSPAWVDYLDHQAPMDGIETVCEKCKIKTNLGTYYTFMQGNKIESSTITVDVGEYATRTVIPAPYKFSESTGVFLCNKCVSLDERRTTKVIFKYATFGIIALFLISIPISIVMKNQFFLGPMMLLIFGVPLTTFQYLTLKSKEKAPPQAYADLYNNPEHPNPENRFDPLLKQLILNTGEKLAIKIRKPSLVKSEVGALYSHEEAEKMKDTGKGTESELSLGSWSNAIINGLASAVVAGLAAGIGNGQLGYGAWMVCYFLFIVGLKPLSRKILAITIMVVLGSLIGSIIQYIR